MVGWSGDIMQARSRAAEAKNDIEIGYAIPKEGAQMFFDNLAIPADAKNVAEAYELINYLYRPEVAAKNSDFLSYANGNLASQKLVDPRIFNDRDIYPDDATLAKLFVITARDPATQRMINRLWTQGKDGTVSKRSPDERNDIRGRSVSALTPHVASLLRATKNRYRQRRCTHSH